MSYLEWSQINRAANIRVYLSLGNGLGSRLRFPDWDLASCTPDSYVILAEKPV